MFAYYFYKTEEFVWLDAPNSGTTSSNWHIPCVNYKLYLAKSGGLYSNSSIELLV